MLNLIKKLASQEQGQGMAEYALILVFIALVVIAALQTVGSQLATRFQDVAGEL